jgi:hypothetical protein
MLDFSVLNACWALDPLPHDVKTTETSRHVILIMLSRKQRLRGLRAKLGSIDH